MTDVTRPNSSPPTVSTVNLDVLDRVGNQMERMLRIVGEQAEKGIGSFLQIVGGVFLLLGLLVRIVAAMSDRWPFPVRFTLGDYALTLGAGLVILIGGGGVKLYEFQVALANYRATIGFTRDREKAATDRTDTVLETVKAPLRA
jgi:hypothetical protein